MTAISHNNSARNQAGADGDVSLTFNRVDPAGGSVHARTVLPGYGDCAAFSRDGIAAVAGVQAILVAGDANSAAARGGHAVAAAAVGLHAVASAVRNGYAARGLQRVLPAACGPDRGTVGINVQAAAIDGDLVAAAALGQHGRAASLRGNKTDVAAQIVDNIAAAVGSYNQIFSVGDCNAHAADAVLTAISQNSIICCTIGNAYAALAHINGVGAALHRGGNTLGDGEQAVGRHDTRGCTGLGCLHAFVELDGIVIGRHERWVGRTAGVNGAAAHKCIIQNDFVIFCRRNNGVRSIFVFSLVEFSNAINASAVAVLDVMGDGIELLALCSHNFHAVFISRT